MLDRSHRALRWGKTTDQTGRDDHFSLPRLHGAYCQSPSRIQRGETTTPGTGGGPLWDPLSGPAAHHT